MRTFLRWFVRQSSKLTKEGAALAAFLAVLLIVCTATLSPVWGAIGGVLFLGVLFLILMKL